MTLGRTRSRSLSPCFSLSASAGRRPRACQREGHGSSPGAGSPAPFPGAAPRAPQGPVPSVGDPQPGQSWWLPEGDGVLGQGCGWRGALGDRATQAPPARAYKWCIYSLPPVPLQYVGVLLNGLLFAEGSVLIFHQQFFCHSMAKTHGKGKRVPVPAGALVNLVCVGWDGAGTTGALAPLAPAPCHGHVAVP